MAEKAGQPKDNDREPVESEKRFTLHEAPDYEEMYVDLLKHDRILMDALKEAETALLRVWPHIPAGKKPYTSYALSKTRRARARKHP